MEGTKINGMRKGVLIRRKDRDAGGGTRVFGGNKEKGRGEEETQKGVWKWGGDSSEKNKATGGSEVIGKQDDRRRKQLGCVGEN